MMLLQNFSSFAKEIANINPGFISCPVEDLLFRLTRGHGDAGTWRRGDAEKF
ncbi:MAG: hypothetical protein RMY29_020905 [Nostoc sp. CreGUA01]|nr:hypothetical protein [Nostoc sp. CreGUA01]